MAKKKHKKVFRAIHIVVLIKMLCSRFFVSSKWYSDMKPLNVNHVPDYILSFLLLLNSLFICSFVEKSVNNLLIIDTG